MFDTGVEIRKFNSPPDANLANLPRPFFKPMNAERRGTMAQQMSHGDKGCLSDPDGFQMHHQNPNTGNIMCCRGTNSIENNNLYVDILTGKAIGIRKADRRITTFFEVSNNRKRIAQLGMDNDWSDLFTSRTEELALIDSMMASVGFMENDYPFKVSNPPGLDDAIVPEFGFDVSVPVSKAEVTGDIMIGSERAAEEAAETGTSEADYNQNDAELTPTNVTDRAASAAKNAEVTQSSYMQGIVVLMCVLKATYGHTVYRYLGHSPPATNAAVTYAS